MQKTRTKESVGREVALRAVGGLSVFWGFLGFTGGAAPESLYFAVDDVVVRLLGFAFMLFGTALMLGQGKARRPLMLTYFLAVIESIVTTAGATPDRAVCVLLFGLPLLLLIVLSRQPSEK